MGAGGGAYSGDYFWNGQRDPDGDGRDEISLGWKEQVNEDEPGNLPPEHPIVDFTFTDLKALLKRAVRATAVLGVVVAVALWGAYGWQTAALFAVGGAISIGSIYEWGRLIRVFSGRMEGSPEGKSSGFGVGLVVTLFLFRLAIFGAAIYVSLRCLHGSPIALLCGLALGLAGLVWEALRVLRG